MLLLLLFAISGQQTMEARFVRAVSGDTLLVETDGKQLQVKLANVSAPGLSEPRGKQAQEFLHKLIQESRDPTFRDDLWIDVVSRAGTDRVVGNVQVVIGHSFPELRKAVGDDIRLELLRAGWLRTSDDAADELQAAMRAAQSAKVGMWDTSSEACQNFCSPSSCRRHRRVRGCRRFFCLRRFRGE